MRRFLTIALFLLAVNVWAEEVPVVKIQTNLGVIVIELNPEKSPKTVENFLSYSKDRFYEGTIFHRVIKDFMIQGGGFTKEFEKKPTHPSIPNEGNNGLKNLRGMVAMARTAQPDSANAQFFINIKDNPFLDYKSADSPGYAVFGKVIQGMAVVDAIQVVETGAGGPFDKDVPQAPIIIEKITITKAAATPWTVESAPKLKPSVKEETNRSGSETETPAAKSSTTKGETEQGNKETPAAKPKTAETPKTKATRKEEDTDKESTAQITETTSDAKLKSSKTESPPIAADTPKAKVEVAPPVATAKTETSTSKTETSVKPKSPVLSGKKPVPAPDSPSKPDKAEPAVR